MFSKEFRQELQIGKYTKWAVDLSEDDLQALFWMIGEFGTREPFSEVLEILDKYKQEASDQVAFARAVEGLKTIAQMVQGERLDVEEARARIRQTCNEILKMIEISKTEQT
jgi:hypothetical protein